MTRHRWLPRLKGRGRLEILTRAQQSFMKRWDRVVSPDLRNTVRQGPVESIGSARFFFDSSEIRPLCATLRKLLPEQVVSIQKQADQICKHRFSLLGYENLDYGPVIDWHADPVNQKRSPRKVWYKVPYLNFDEVGDHKVIWELNRHQHLVVLAKAYCLTGEQRYVQELCAQWYHWNKENPYAIGINWASTLEVAFRTLSWLWVRELLKDCAAVPPSFPSDLLVGLAQNARYISQYLSTYFSPNTHLIGEALALFFVGTLCPQLRSASDWETLGWDILLKESDRQVQADGIYFEQSVYYHVYALDMFLHARILAERNARPIPAAFNRKIEQMAEALAILGQTGTPPRIGDDDGGRLFDPRRNGAAHLCDPLSTAAVLFDRADFKAVSAGLREETVWLLGANGAATFAKLLVINPKLTSRGFESSGFYVMASDTPRVQLVARAGPMGALRAGHSHCDLLSLNLSINDQEILGDPGTYKYVSASDERDAFRGTSAHNTLRIDGRNQAESGDSFSWVSSPAVRVRHWMTGRTVDVLAAEHSGYQHLTSPATHRRWVVHLKNQFLFVRDEVEGEGRHLLETYWHLAPGLRWKQQNEGSFLVENDASHLLTVFATSGHNNVGKIRSGWYSQAYGAETDISVLEFSAVTEVPFDSATVLFPGRAPAARLAALSPADRKGSSAVVGYRFEESGRNHSFFFATSKEPWAWQDWSSDARFLYTCADRNNELVHLVACDGSFAESHGRRVFDSEKLVDRHEWLASAVQPNVGPTDPGSEQLARVTSPVTKETVSRSDRSRGSE
jgi:Heparinase II/III-like protein/Heparinase II/III N-terminus